MFLYARDAVFTRRLRHGFCEPPAPPAVERVRNDVFGGEVPYARELCDRLRCGSFMPAVMSRAPLRLSAAAQDPRGKRSTLLTGLGGNVAPPRAHDGGAGPTLPDRQ